jgi:hypothetical protein
MRRNCAAKAEVTTVGRAAENTSLIIGLATENIPMPPHATQKKVAPRRWNCGILIAWSTVTSGIFATAELDEAAGIPATVYEGWGARMTSADDSMTEDEQEIVKCE